MNALKMRGLVSVGGLLCCGMPLSAVAGLGGTWIDTDNNAANGVQSRSWPQPSTINIVIPAGLTGVAAEGFRAGVLAWMSHMTTINVQFHQGTAPAGTTNIVEVIISAPANPLPPLNDRNLEASGGNGGPVVPPVAGQNSHASNASSGTITIPQEILLTLTPPAPPPDNSERLEWLRIYMQNLGTHEFGHVLGLDHCSSPPPDPETGDVVRQDAMDPSYNINFNPAGTAVSGVDPYVGPSARDLVLLRQHYAVPVPSAAAVIGISSLLAARRRRPCPARCV